MGRDHCTEMPGRKPELPCRAAFFRRTPGGTLSVPFPKCAPPTRGWLLPPQGEVAGEPGGGVPRGGEGGGRGGGEVDREGTCRLIGSCMAFMAESPADDRLGISGRAAEN